MYCFSSFTEAWSVLFKYYPHPPQWCIILNTWMLTTETILVLAACSWGSEVGMYIASGADRHLDITFGLQVVESSSLVSVLFREAFSHPYISFFHYFPYFFEDRLPSLCHTVQLKPMIKAQISGRVVSNGTSDVAFASVYSEKTRLKNLLMMMKLLLLLLLLLWINRKKRRFLEGARNWLPLRI